LPNTANNKFSWPEWEAPATATATKRHKSLANNNFELTLTLATGTGTGLRPENRRTGAQAHRSTGGTENWMPGGDLLPGEAGSLQMQLS